MTLYRNLGLHPIDLSDGRQFFPADEREMDEKDARPHVEQGTLAPVTMTLKAK